MLRTLKRKLAQLSLMRARLGTAGLIATYYKRYCGSYLQHHKEKIMSTPPSPARVRNAHVGIVCPACRRPLGIGAEAQCECGFKVDSIDGVPILRTLAQDEQVDYRVESATLPRQNSSNLQIEFVQQALQSDGLILELGAGIDVCTHPNLVKTDAFVYSSDLDYVVDAHAMPFEDNTFDYVYSLAVFEHLHTPWVAAKEIFRVLKPGGKVYVLTAFMQHLHGYPHHYFNMTTMGAERIFSDFEIIHSGPSPHCPMDQLAVILLDLHQMSSNLPGDKSAKALCHSIEDFCQALPNVQEQLIKPEVNFEAWRRIATGVEIIAMKPL